MPVNTNQVFPVPAEEGVTVPALNFTQFLSEYAGVVVGKLDTTSGDMNEFAHGKGDTQFMNMAFNLNPALLMTVPYSTLGAGLIILPTKDPHAAIVTFSVVSAEGEADTSGFDNLNSDTLSFNLEARVRTDFFGLTGHQLVGAIYSNRDFTSMDQRLSLPPGSNSIAKETDSWSVYYNFDQYFYEPVKGSGRGVGIFGRFAATDGNPNFLHYFYSLGIGGKGIMASRPHDRFGLGWYYIDIKNPTFTGPLTTRVALQDEQGVEAYYSVALTPWAHLTPNIQVSAPGTWKNECRRPLRDKGKKLKVKISPDALRKSFCRDFGKPGFSWPSRNRLNLSDYKSFQGNNRFSIWLPGVARKLI